MILDVGECRPKHKFIKKEDKKEKKRDRELKIYICLNLKERVATPKDRHNRDQKVVGWLYPEAICLVLNKG